MSGLDSFYSTVDDVFEGMESVWDRVWQGETDNQKKKRLAEEQAASDKLRSSIGTVLVVSAVAVGGIIIATMIF
jgi:hypothetical protein